MKACVLEGIDRLEYKEVPCPVPRKGDVLLHIRACGICSSDFDRVKKTGTYHFPTIPGHEFAGEIAAVGSGVDEGLVGRRAVVFPLLPCRSCSSCAKERWALCKNYSYFGSRCDGGFAEYLAVPLWNIRLFPADISFAVAALTEPAAVAWHAVSEAGEMNGKSVCISGSGVIAILCGLWAREHGVEQIFLICREKAKKAFIEQKFGLQTLMAGKSLVSELFSRTLGEGADVVLECVGTPASLEQSISLARQGGVVILVGNPSGDMTLSRKLYWKILRSELVLRGVWNSRFGGEESDWARVLHLFETMHSDLEALITHRFRLDECRHAFETMTGRKELAIKGMFINDQA